MKNIAIVIGDISKSAGTERAVTNLSNILQNSGNYNVIIISQYSKIGQKCYYPLNSSVEIEHLEMHNNGLLDRFKTSKGLVQKIDSLCNKYAVDVIIGTTHGYNIQVTKLKVNAKKIGCEHLNYDSAPWYSRILRRFAYPRLDAVVCLTKKDAEKYNFIDKNKLFVIQNSLSFCVETPAKLENKRIIAIGRLTRQKGWDYLVAAAKKIKAEIPDWHIDIYGAGEEKESLLMQMKNNCTDDFISIHDPTSNIKNEMLSSSIMVETSRWEGLPMVLVEGEACGLPLVGFDCPEGPNEIIKHNECGYLVSVGDIEKLSEYVIKIAKNAELRKQLGKKSIELAERFSPESVGKQWFRLIEKLDLGKMK